MIRTVTPCAIQVRHELEGWSLFSVLLEPTPDAAADGRMAALRRDVAAAVRRELAIGGLAEHPPVAAMRRLFRGAGCDPTRYRPSSEALLRRLLKGSELPAISPLVDLNNCLSARLAVPCCVMDEERVAAPFVLRAGREGESYESLKGPFNLAGKPLLVDAHGPCDAPITGSRRVMMRPETRRAWLVAYLPAGVVAAEAASAELDALLAAAPVARVARRPEHRPLEHSVERLAD